MKIKRLIAAATLATFSVPSLALFDSLWREGSAKYKPGDCITPSDQSLAFYGHYARVDGVISFDGTPQPGAYHLYFPIYVPRTPLYAQSIDDKTEQVSDKFCEHQQAVSASASQWMTVSPTQYSG